MINCISDYYHCEKITGTSGCLIKIDGCLCGDIAVHGDICEIS